MLDSRHAVRYRFRTGLRVPAVLCKQCEPYLIDAGGKALKSYEFLGSAAKMNQAVMSAVCFAPRKY